MKKTFIAVRSTLYASGFVLVWAWLAVSVRSFDEQLPFALPISLRLVGVVICAAGAMLTASCIFTFVTKGHGTPAPFDAPVDFVATGPYRYVRNPMYIGGANIILGAGLAVGSPAVVLLAVAFGLLAHLFVLLYEEPTLESRFGASYRQYKSSVNRWLPRRQSPSTSS